MSKVIAFIQVHGRPEPLEIEVSAATTVGEIHDSLKALGIDVDSETFIFVDEGDEHLPHERHHPVHGIKRGCRIHVSRCRRIKTTVHFNGRPVERDFAPGVRVRAVKEWAVQQFRMSPQDAAEHVLQLCDSTVRPATDAPLAELTHGHTCSVCFNLVPEKRVEG